MIRFRERMAGPLRSVGPRRWTLPPRGTSSSDDDLRTLATEADCSDGVVLDLDHLHVLVEGVDPAGDGFRARITSGSVRGIGGTELPVRCGFADLLAVAPGRRRMHYRLLVLHGAHGYVVEGVKTVTGAPWRAWRETTTLATVVVRVRHDEVAGHDDGSWVAAGCTDGVVVAAGVLRVRGLARQVASMRGAVGRFLVGFARRVLAP